MPDVSYGSEQMPLNDDRTPDSGCDAICIDADRIYDSCGAKDCLSDLPLMFTEANQALKQRCIADYGQRTRRLRKKSCPLRQRRKRKVVLKRQACKV